MENKEIMQDSTPCISKIRLDIFKEIDVDEDKDVLNIKDIKYQP